jgi:hypothetical protein
LAVGEQWVAGHVVVAVSGAGGERLFAVANSSVCPMLSLSHI